MADSGAEPSVIGRRKVRNACLPCQTRKRKCNGKLPCSMCLRYEYDCQYTAKRGSDSPQDEAITKQTQSIPSKRPAPSPDESTSISPPFAAHQATSSVAFSHAVASNSALIQTSRAIGWNIGLPDLQDSGQPILYAVPISNLSSAQTTFAVIQQFFGTFATYAPVISLQASLSLVQKRYQEQPQHLQPLTDATVSVILGLSYTFSNKLEYELIRKLATNTKLCLDLCSDQDPTDVHIVANALYTMLLRSIGGPHACWMASCTTVHLLDAIPSRQGSGPMYECFTFADDDKQTLHWTTRLLHMWIAFEIGRPHISTTTAVVDEHVLSKILEKHGFSILALFMSTRVISPDPSNGATELEQSFKDIEAFDCSSNDVLGLSRCVVAMTTFRRRLVVQPPLSSSFKARMIAIGLEGLECVERLLQPSSPFPGPWWHLCNLPFQFLCLVLVIGALSKAPRAMRTLRATAVRYPTDRVRETLTHAERILHAMYAQKLADCKLLEESLGLDTNIMQVSMPGQVSGQHTSASNAMFNFPMIPMNWEDWNWDMFPNTGASIFDISTA